MPALQFLADTEMQKLQPFFPSLVPIQSLNLRAALFRCLNELKKSGDLGKEVIIRKSMFDDCKGEKLQELLLSFSTIVLRKVLATGQAGNASIAGRLALAKTVTSKEHGSLLPLAIAHRASLTALLRKKRELRERCVGFGHTLKLKELELDHRFEAVVATQNLLDQHAIPDHTVSRVSALFERNWQGNGQMVSVIEQGEEQGLDDALLDKPFEATWSEVSQGKHRDENGTSRHGLLEDLSRRVAEQQSRLGQWKDFREAMQRDIQTPAVSKKQELGLTRNTSDSQDMQKCKDRDFVFSPRKSPRKSGWKIDQGAITMSPTPSELGGPKEQNTSSKTSIPQPTPVLDGSSMESPPEAQARLSVGATITHDASLDDSDDSGFSEVLGEHLHYTDSQDNLIPVSILEASSPSIRSKRLLTHDSDDPLFNVPRIGAHGPSVTSSRPHATIEDGILNSKGNDQTPLALSPNCELDAERGPRDEDEILAEQIISMTINAAPTPAKPKQSLAERTRQSMAFAGPSGFQGLTAREASPPSSPSIAASNETRFTNNSTGSTLLERTRQSISMLPPKAQASRKSMLNRRESKIYPTNQFETPKKQLAVVEEATPPEVLFSPGAGYDSVFKSRPRIAVSPTPSPMLS